MNAALFITICLMTVIAAITAGIWARSRRFKPLLIGLGLLLIPLGCFLTGLTGLIYHGVLSLIDWAQRTVWDNTMSWGAGLIGGGVLLLVIGSLLKSRPKPALPESPAKPAVTKAGASKSEPAKSKTAKPAAEPVKPAVTASQASQSARPTGKPALDAEDAEVEELLRKRGIM